jgi:hypothetical protein
MTAPSPHAIPRWKSLGPVTVFTAGPWEAIGFVWLLGLTALAIWLATPVLRVGAVVDPILAALVGAALAATIAIRVADRLAAVRQTMAAFVFAGMIGGAVLAAIAAMTIFAPVLEKAAPCAPFFASRESLTGRVASWVLPIALFGSWALYLIARMPVIARREDLLHGPRSRFRAYSRTLTHLLPIRGGLTVLFVLLFVVIAYRRDVPARANTSHDLAGMLQRPAIAVIDRASGGVALAQLAAARRKEEEDALQLLEQLSFDRAAVAVRRCGCDWLAPGDHADPRISDAADGFARLDEEVNSFQRSGWQPSAATAAAMLKILPLWSNGSGVAPLRLGDFADPASVSPGSPVRTEETDYHYKDEPVVRVRIRSLRTDNKLVEVGIRLPGRAGSERSLLDVISQRVGAAPAAGSCSVGGGAYCAVWHLGSLDLRGGPEDPDPTANSLMWLVFYEPQYRSSAQCCGGVTTASATPPRGTGRR